MHIVLEGIVPVELGCILHGLCVVDKAVTLEALNCESHLFWGKITVEKSHTPLQLASRTWAWAVTNHESLAVMDTLEILTSFGFVSPRNRN